MRRRGPCLCLSVRATRGEVIFSFGNESRWRESVAIPSLPPYSAFLPPALPSLGPTLPLVLRAERGEAVLFIFFIGSVVYGGNDLVCRGRSEAASSSSSSSSLSPSVPGWILPGLSIRRPCCCKSDAARPEMPPKSGLRCHSPS